MRAVEGTKPMWPFKVFFCLFFCHTYKTDSFLWILCAQGVWGLKVLHRFQLQKKSPAACSWLGLYPLLLVYISRALPSRNVWVSSPLLPSHPFPSMAGQRKYFILLCNNSRVLFIVHIDFIKSLTYWFISSDFLFQK